MAFTFNDALNECYDQLGLDSGDTNNVTRVKRWLNATYKDISSRWAWKWLRSREVIQTIPDYTTGTVAINSTSTTVTGTGTTFTSGMVGRYIQFGGGSGSTLDWYKITAFGSATSLTIEIGYAPTTNLTAGQYIIRNFFYSLSSSADRILDIRNWNTPVKLDPTDYRLVDDRRPNTQSIGTTTAYFDYGYDSSGNAQITPFSFPSDTRNFEVRTLQRVTDLVNGGDTPLIPDKWRHVMWDGALWRGFSYLRKTDIATLYFKVYEGEIEEMLKNDKVQIDQQPILQAMDSAARTMFLRMPDQFPIVR